MFKRILVALDGTPSSERALKQAIELARLTGAALTALSVEEKLPAYAASVGEVEDAKREMDVYFAKIQSVATERARAAGVPLETLVRVGHAAQTIVHYADEGGFDLVVIGAGGRRGLGGTADRVTETASCSVLIARVDPLSMRVKDIMSPEVTTVSPNASLAEVVELLLQRGVKAAPVVDGGQVVGIITGGDLLQRAGMGLRLSLQKRLPPDVLAVQLRQLAAQQKTAKDVMTTPVITVRDEARLSEAAQLMVDKHLKRLPVVGGQGELVGIVSRLDVLATVASGTQSEEVPPPYPVDLSRTAGDVMVRDVATASADTPLIEVVNALFATPWRRVVVVDELGHVLGIIVDAHLLEYVRSRTAPGVLQSLFARLSPAWAETLTLSGRAADVMERSVFTVQQDTPIAGVIEMMVEKHVKRLVVTDRDGRLVGMVDRESLLRAVAA